MSQDARVWCVSLSAGGLRSDISVTVGKKSQNKTTGTKQMGLSVGGGLVTWYVLPAYVCEVVQEEKTPTKQQQRQQKYGMTGSHTSQHGVTVVDTL